MTDPCGCDVTGMLPDFDPAAFRLSFFEFTDAEKWSDALLLQKRQDAENYISPKPGKRLDAGSRVWALGLMTAHLLLLGQAAASGGTSGLIASASVDKVSVSLTPAPVKNHFQYWLAQTPRGAELLAYLKSKAAGGLYVGSKPPERAAFRKAGGVFVSGKDYS